VEPAVDRWRADLRAADDLMHVPVKLTRRRRVGKGARAHGTRARTRAPCPRVGAGRDSDCAESVTRGHGAPTASKNLVRALRRRAFAHLTMTDDLVDDQIA